MPYYYRRPYRKTYYKKKFNRTYRKKWSKTRKGMGQNAKRFFKIKAVQDVTTTVTGTFDTVYTNNVGGATDWTNIAALFDDYRVCGLKLKYIPSLPNDTSTQTGFTPFYVGGDSNDVTAWTSSADALQQENTKVKNLYRPWTYYYYFQKLGNVNLTNGYRATNVTTASQGIKTYATGLDISQKYGEIVLTFYISAKNRK